MSEEVFERIKAIMLSNFDVKDSSVITPQASLAGDLGADSLDAVEFIMAMEDAFNIEIPDEDAEKLLTVQDVVDYVMKKIPVEQ